MATATAATTVAATGQKAAAATTVDVTASSSSSSSSSGGSRSTTAATSSGFSAADFRVLMQEDQDLNDQIAISDKKEEEKRLKDLEEEAALEEVMKRLEDYKTNFGAILTEGGYTFRCMDCESSLVACSRCENMSALLDKNEDGIFQFNCLGGREQQAKRKMHVKFIDVHEDDEGDDDDEDIFQGKKKVKKAKVDKQRKKAKVDRKKKGEQK